MAVAKTNWVQHGNSWEHSWHMLYNDIPLHCGDVKSDITKGICLPKVQKDQPILPIFQSAIVITLRDHLTWLTGKWTQLEDVFPINDGDVIPACYVSLQGRVHIINSTIPWGHGCHGLSVSTR